MNSTGNFGRKKDLLSYLQPGFQGCGEENTKGKMIPMICVGFQSLRELKT